VIIAAGFAIFLLSDFPTTQRFGVVVLCVTIIDILANLFVLPLIGAPVETPPGSPGSQGGLILERHSGCVSVSSSSTRPNARRYRPKFNSKSLGRP
jgi:hypothetical protein